MDHVSRTALAGIVLVATLCSGGCLTVHPTVTASTEGSAVFENVSTSESWSGGHVVATVRLTPNATTEEGVTKLTVISESGESFDRTTLDSGQTKVTMYLPPDQNATLVAVNTVNGTVVENRTVAVGGNQLP